MLNLGDKRPDIRPIGLVSSNSNTSLLLLLCRYSEEWDMRHDG